MGYNIVGSVQIRQIGACQGAWMLFIHGHLMSGDARSEKPVTGSRLCRNHGWRSVATRMERI